MPDLLIVSASDPLRFALEDIGRAKGFRIKTAFDVEGALVWLKSWTFDVLCIEAGLGLSEQEQLADELWKENPIAPFLIFEDSDSTTTKAPHEIDERLFGAEFLRGPVRIKTFTEILEKVAPRGAMYLENFPIMVVEDLDSPRDIICAFIESMGFSKVIGKGSVKDALAQLTEDPTCCSCIVTDIRMPEFGGEYLIEQVRRHAKLQHLPIIILTAYGSAETLLACLQAGASGFLVKPPKRNDLARELGRAYRIASRGRSPRLASPDEIEDVRVALEKRGFD